MPPSSCTSPKSYSKVSNLMTGCATAHCTAQTTENNIANKNLIIQSLQLLQSFVSLQIPPDFVNIHAIICIGRHGEEFLFGNVARHHRKYALTTFYEQLLRPVAYYINIAHRIRRYEIAIVVRAKSQHWIYHACKNFHSARGIYAHDSLVGAGKDIAVVICKPRGSVEQRVARK